MELREEYENPAFGLVGASEFARKKGIKEDKARKEVEKLDAYNLSHTPKKRFPRLKTVVPGNQVFLICQMDLQILNDPEIVDVNDGVKYLLCVIDSVSRFAFVKPLTTKTAGAVCLALGEIIAQMPKKPRAIFSDNGTEFQGQAGLLMRREGIDHWTSNGPIKASIVERFNLTLKLRLRRLWNSRNSFRYVDVLDDLVYNYNHSFHRTIQMTPAEAIEPENFEKLNKTLNAEKEQHEKSLPVRKALKIDQYVRITNPNTDRFTRTTHDQVSHTIYQIADVYQTKPLTYILKTLGHPPEIIDQRFYREELFPVPKPERFVIREIKRYNPRTRKYLVSWLHYPDTAPYWTEEPAENIPAEILNSRRLQLIED